MDRGQETHIDMGNIRRSGVNLKSQRYHGGIKTNSAKLIQNSFRACYGFGLLLYGYDGMIMVCQMYQQLISKLTVVLIYLGFPSALQDVYQGTSHLLFALDTDDWFQHRAEQHIVVGSVFSKFLIQLHWKDIHTLVAGFYPDHRSCSLPLPWIRCINRVPFLNKLPTGHTFYWDVYQAHIVVLVFFLLLV